MLNPTFNLLTCPACKGAFSSLTLTDCAVVCPGCGAEVFRYRFDDLPLTQGRLYAQLDTEKGVLLTHLAPWLHPERRAATPILLGYLFTKIADTLPEE